MKINLIFKFLVTPKVVKKDSSSSDSSDDSDDEPAKKKPVVKAPVVNGKAVTNGKSSSSEDSSDDEAPAKKAKITNQSANNSVAKKKDSSSSEDSSDDEEKPAAKTPAKLTTPAKTSTPHNFKPMKFVSGGFVQPTIKKPTEKSSSSEDSSDSNESNEQKPIVQSNGTPAVGKKRKLSLPENDESPFAKKANNGNNSLNKSSNSKPNTPFRRVKNEDVDVDTRLANNSFDAKVRIVIEKRGIDFY